VIEALDGREAVDKACANGVDLVLLDLQMPKLNGFQALAELKKNPSFREVPIVALTASAMHGDREQALAAGFSSYLAKPVDITVLRSEIERLIGSTKSSSAK
jgi:CheY-like chemotaxis protein